jgi:MFS family permease
MTGPANYMLFAANTCFISGYAMVVPHLLFIHSSSETSSLHRAVILGMSIYATLQISGIWLLNSINQRLGKSLVFCALLRIAGVALVLVSHSVAILVGSAVLAFGHAIFYKQSRLTASAIEPSGCFPFSQSAYAGLQLSTHAAFVIAPAIGAILLAPGSNRIILFFSVAALNLVGIYLLAELRNHERTSVLHEEVKAQPTGVRDLRRSATLDAVRLLLIVISYSAFVALSPIKTQQAGLGTWTNAELSALNSAIVIVILTLPSGLLEWANCKMMTDAVLGMIVLVLITSLFAQFSSYIALLSIWSILEAIDIPIIEKRIFGDQSYSLRVIDRLLLVDGLGCFAGPLLADIAQGFGRWL